MPFPLRRRTSFDDGWLLAALLVTFAAVLEPLEPLSGQQSGNAGAAASVDAAALMEAAPEEWLTYGRDQAETHHSPLDQINAGNVDRLGLAWSWEIPKTGARLEATPLVSDGVMYATGPHSFVFALDARTGEKLWQWDPGIPDERQGGPSVCCGDVNRGVAIYGDKLFAGLLDGRLVALNKETGLVEWVVQTTPPGQDYSITGAPRIAAGNVIIGNGGAEYGIRGFVTAYDAETGVQAWRTYTVPGNPADGFESEAMRVAAESWTGEWWVVGGGGSVWDAFAYDPEANLLYVGTGNGAPWSRDIRSPGGGDNLYLSSILALNADDGELVWHYQTTPGDDWDYTATQPLMLLDLTIDGRDRKVIVQAPKNGFFFVIDRLTGEFISGEPYADDRPRLSACAKHAVLLRDGHRLRVHAGAMEHGHHDPRRGQQSSAGPARADRPQDDAGGAGSCDQHGGLARSVPGREWRHAFDRGQPGVPGVGQPTRRARREHGGGALVH